VAFVIQNSAAKGRVKMKSIFTTPQCFGDAARSLLWFILSL